jgi:AAHS family 4-hydroxybenzoate transporter-like MFS transporter
MFTHATRPADIGTAPGMVDVARVIDERPIGAHQRLVVLLTALSVVIDGVDSQLLGIAIPVMMTEWHVTRTAFAPVLALGFVGMMVGGALAGLVGDRLGRRVALIASVLLFGVMTVSASMVHGLLALGVFRFFVGVGLQGASPNASALVAEYVPLRHRAFAITLTIVCVPAGAMLAGLIAIPVLPALGWRALFGIGGLIPVAVGVILLRFLPESPRYLVQHPSRWPELSRNLERVGYRAAPGATFVDLAEEPAVRTPLKTILGPSTTVDTVALWSAFFFCLLAVYSGFNWVPSMLTAAGLPSTIANTGITVYNLGGVVGALTGAVAIKRLGSKPTMLTIAGLASLTGLIMSSMTFAPTSPTLPIIVMLAVIGALINGVQVTMYALAAHIYPTAVRSTGIGVASSIGRIGAILSTYAGAWALEFGGSRSFFLLVAAAMFAVLLSLAVIRRHIPGTGRLTVAPVPLSA